MLRTLQAVAASKAMQRGAALLLCLARASCHEHQVHLIALRPAHQLSCRLGRRLASVNAERQALDLLRQASQRGVLLIRCILCDAAPCLPTLSLLAMLCDAIFRPATLKVLCILRGIILCLATPMLPTDMAAWWYRVSPDQVSSRHRAHSLHLRACLSRCMAPLPLIARHHIAVQFCSRFATGGWLLRCRPSADMTRTEHYFHANSSALRAPLTQVALIGSAAHNLAAHTSARVTGCRVAAPS